jgi:O-antigen ligase
LFVRSSASKYWKYLRWLAFVPMILQLVRTGSRGGAVCLLAGIAVLLLRTDRLRGRLKGVVILGAVLLFSAWALVTDESMSYRWQATFETGETAGRWLIMESALEMFAEKPLVGWGATKHLYVLADRCGVVATDVRDTHNDVLWVMTSTGLLGSVPVLLGVGLCCRSAWRARKGSHGWLPLALVAAVLAMSMSVTVHKRKETWLVFAYATAAASAVASTRFVPPRRAIWA